MIGRGDVAGEARTANIVGEGGRRRRVSQQQLGAPGRWGERAAGGAPAPAHRESQRLMVAVKRPPSVEAPNGAATTEARETRQQRTLLVPQHQRTM